MKKIKRFVRFIFTYIFIYNMFLVFITISLLSMLLFFGLNFHTRNGKTIEVPDITKKSIAEAQLILNQKKLRYNVVDSTRFDPAYLPFSVLTQEPEAGDEVKKNRTIYITLNPANYNQVRIPDVIQTTRRSAESVLIALGFQIGEITYINNIGKDMVLQIRYNNSPISSGEKLPKTSRIDLVLGNGKSEKKVL